MITMIAKNLNEKFSIDEILIDNKIVVKRFNKNEGLIDFSCLRNKIGERIHLYTKTENGVKETIHTLSEVGTNDDGIDFIVMDDFFDKERVQNVQA